MTRAIALAAAVALAALSALGGVASTARAATWSKTYDVGAGATLQVRTDDADVRVVAWSEPRIRIDVETEGWTIGSGGLRLAESQAGDQVRFELHGPHFEFHLFDVGHRHVRVEVHAPAHTRLDLKTGDGNVACEGLAGSLRIQTGDGDITAARLSGDIDLHTGDGRVSGRGLDGRLTASTGDGRMGLRGRFEALDVSSGDGGVTLDIAPGSRVNSGWRVRTGDGPVVVRVPPDLKTTIDARSGDGGITVDVPVTLIGTLHENALHATLNGGGPDLRVRTTNGSIVFEPFVARPEESAIDSTWDARRTGPHHPPKLHHAGD